MISLSHYYLHSNLCLKVYFNSSALLELNWLQFSFAQIYQHHNMTLNLDLNEDYLDFDDDRVHHLPNCRFEQLSPWVESVGQRQNKAQILRNVRKPKQYNDQSLKKIDFLATLNKQVEVKRKRFRTMMQRPQPIQKDISLRDLPTKNESSGGIGLNLPQKYRCKLERNLVLGPKQKKVLNTTMYVYESQQSRKMSSLGSTTRVASFGHSLATRNDKNQLRDKQEGELFFGSKNLQRILKMKEKIRVKNNYVVKKIRQQKIKSDKQTTQNYLSGLHSLRSWNSATLQNDRSRDQLEAQKFPTAHSNLKGLDRNFKLKRAITTKYFS